MAGSIAEGARIWVGKSEQPLTFDRDFFSRLIGELGGVGEIRIGSKFDDPGPGSLGEWIQRDRKIAMNPAVYIGGLLIDEGYAESPRRGRIVIFQEPRRSPRRDIERGERPAKGILEGLIDKLDSDQVERALDVVREILAEDEEASPFESLRDDPDFILPSARRRSVGRFKPVDLKGRPLSQDVIEDRR